MNLPHYLRQIFNENKNILLLGIGGGYDIMGAIPFYMASDDNNFVFANYNAGAKTLSKFDTQDLPKETSQSYVEYRLAQWLAPQGVSRYVYAIPKTGVKTAASYIESIVRENDIQAMILVDGGVDSLMTGDEEGSGTWLDDTVMMAAATQVDKRMPKVLACLGFGTELEEGLCHHHVLKNMADLLADEAFFGCCALLRDSWEFRQYVDACEFVWENQRKSHIHTKVISAVNGLFGAVNQYDGVDAQVLGGDKCKNFISPLMSIYWCFSPSCVLAKNKMAEILKDTNTSTDVLMLYRQMIDKLNVNKRKKEPIPY
jgi:hypothetical protein